MPYDQYMLKLSKGQISKLAKGKKVRLSHSQLTQPGDVKVFLTKQQAKKIATRAAKGLGCDIGGFDMKQIEHNVKYGMGFWSNVKSFLGKAANVLNRSIVQPVMSGLKPIFEDAADRVSRRAVSRVGEVVDTGLRRFGAGMKKPAQTRVKGQMPPALKAYWDARRAGKTLPVKRTQTVKRTQPVKGKKPMPEGLRKYLDAKKAGKLPLKKVKGEGFFSDVFRPVAGMAAEEGLKYAAPHIGKAISGKGLMGNFGLFGGAVKRQGMGYKQFGSSFRLNPKM